MSEFESSCVQWVLPRGFPVYHIFELDFFITIIKITAYVIKTIQITIGQIVAFFKHETVFFSTKVALD